MPFAVPRSERVAFPAYRIEPLRRDHDRADFRCGKPPLDRFLQDQAFDWVGRRLAEVFVLVEDGAARVLGFYTLSMTRIDSNQLPPVVAKRFPRSAEVGAVLLGQLAVDEAWHGRGFGRDLLIDALDRALETSRQIASYAMVVDAIDDDAAAFYVRFGFTPFPSTPRRLFLPLATHAKRASKTRRDGQ